MVFMDYVKESISSTYSTISPSSRAGGKVGVINFLWHYQETGTIARAPGTGQASRAGCLEATAKYVRRLRSLTYLCLTYFIGGMIWDALPSDDCRGEQRE